MHPFKVYNWWSTYSQNCVTVSTISPHVPACPSPEQTLMRFLSLCLPGLDLLYEWIMERVVLGDSFFHGACVLKAHPFIPSLWTNNVLLDWQATCRLPIHQWVDIWVVSPFGSREQGCHEHSSTYSYLPTHLLKFLWVCTAEWDCWTTWSMYVQFH